MTMSARRTAPGYASFAQAQLELLHAKSSDCERGRERFSGMHSQLLVKRPMFFFAPEHGGDAVAGGGHPANESPPLDVELGDAFGTEPGGRGQSAGIGVPGTKTNPVGAYRDAIEARAREIWEEEGRPDGRAEEHWLRAEAELGQRNA